MNAAHRKVGGWKALGIAWLVFACLAASLAACASIPGLFAPTPTPSPSLSPTPSATPSLSPTPSDTPTPTPIPPGLLPVWSTFPAPLYTPVTPIPPPFGRLALPDEMKVLVLAGQDVTHPFVGRTDALMLLIYHPRLAKLSLVSVPPDLFGYLPGFTMQRLSSAYAAGGAKLLVSSIEYNLGIRPDDWMVANWDDYANLVNELGGLQVSILENIPTACGDRIYPGEVLMDGDFAACYASLRVGSDESARGLRQQQLLMLTLERMLHGGNLVKLPDIYALFRDRVDTSLTAKDVLDSTGLALKFGDPHRIAYFQIGSNETARWVITKQPPDAVFLPERRQLAEMLQAAIDFANQPAPFSEVVLTLQSELTTSPTPTLTPTATPIPTDTPTPVVSPTITPTPTPTGSETVTPTITVTPTPTP